MTNDDKSTQPGPAGSPNPRTEQETLGFARAYTEPTTASRNRASLVFQRLHDSAPRQILLGSPGGTSISSNINTPYSRYSYFEGARRRQQQQQQQQQAQRDRKGSTQSAVVHRDDASNWESICSSPREGVGVHAMNGEWQWSGASNYPPHGLVAWSTPTQQANGRSTGEIESPPVAPGVMADFQRPLNVDGYFGLQVPYNISRSQTTPLAPAHSVMSIVSTPVLLNVVEEEEDNDEYASPGRDAETAPLIGTDDGNRGGATARAGKMLGHLQRKAGTWVSGLRPEHSKVLKAVMAYALAALFAFVPSLRDWLGDIDYMSPHLVANATIWFHAAKSRGDLVEGGLVGFIWVCVTSAVTYGALFMAEWMHNMYAIDSAERQVLQEGDIPEALPLAVQSKVVSLVVFVFGYSWCLAFFKANADRASVGTATAISNVVLYLVMLREVPIVNYKSAANEQHTQLMGSGRVPWPFPSDRESLAESVGKKTEHIFVAVMLGMAISLGVGWAVWPTTASEALRRQLFATFDSLRELLPQLLAPIIDDKAPLSRQRKQRGAKSEQLKENLRTHRERLQGLKAQLVTAGLEPTAWHAWTRRRQLSALVASIAGLNQHLSSMSSALELRVIDHSPDALEGDADAEAHAAVVASIRGPVQQLAFVCDKTLMAIQHMLDSALDPAQQPRGEDGHPAADQTEFKVNRLRLEMVDAIAVFQEEYDAAVGEITRMAPGAASSTEEQLFIVHFFVFSMREFVDELFAILPQVAAACHPPPSFSQQVATHANPYSAYRLVCGLGLWVWQLLRALWDTGATTELEAWHEVPQHSGMRALHSPQPRTRMQRVAHAIWKAFMWGRRATVKFATKYALLVTALSLPCYISIDAYLEFRRQRLEWAVISAAAIMVPTVGGSLLVSAYRIFGTCAGGLAAFAVYETAKDAPVAAYALLVVFSVPCFHVMLNSRYPKIGQFALMTFGVVLINKWVAREDQSESASALATRRTASVALGVFAGMVVTLYVWPFEARVRVREALSWWLLTSSLLYKQLWLRLWDSEQENIARPKQASDSDLDDGLPGEWDTALSTVREYLDIEQHMQTSLIEIRALLRDTHNEPRLKGPFPSAEYARMINACQRLLDVMVAARWVSLPACESMSPDTLVVGEGRGAEERVAGIARGEREQRDALVALTLYVLASALVLKTPLPAVLPPVFDAQKRVAKAMREIINPDGDVRDSRARYVFYYTQVMLAWEVVHELEIVCGLMRDLYGSHGRSL